MAINLELKARCRSLRRAEAVARRLGASQAATLHQVDTYFGVPSGRLKLRSIRGVRDELIFYDRPTTAAKEGRWSSYLVFPISDAARIHRALELKWPVSRVVRKRRRVYLVNDARIHLDVVRGLGSYIEFEVLMRHGKASAMRQFRALKAAFDIRSTDLIGGSYSDLVKPLRRRG